MRHPGLWTRIAQLHGPALHHGCWVASVKGGQDSPSPLLLPAALPPTGQQANDLGALPWPQPPPILAGVRHQAAAAGVGGYVTATCTHMWTWLFEAPPSASATFSDNPLSAGHSQVVSTSPMA